MGVIWAVLYRVVSNRCAGHNRQLVKGGASRQCANYFLLKKNSDYLEKNTLIIMIITHFKNNFLINVFPIL